jgi:hypothetical protein
MTNDAKPAKGKSWRDVLPVHPAADLFPLMSPDELKVLGEDIRKNGLTSPITLWAENISAPVQLLDGRNRLDAMEAAGIPYRMKRHTHGHNIIVVDGELKPASQHLVDADPYAFVISANIHRRHLTAEQKREIIAKVLKAKPGQSNLAIAKQVKADDKTVASVRRELEARSEIPNAAARADTKGRKQPAKRKRRTLDDFEAEKRARKAKAGDIEDAINRFIRNITDHTTDYCLILRAWLDEEHSDLPDAGRSALEHTLHQCANEILLLAQAIREAVPAKGPKPAEPTRAAAIPTTPAANEMPDLPEFLRRTA